jgi:drug/metabolite transporter (DMT)-like permease
MKRKIATGYLYIILATIAFSNVYVFSKAALNEISLPLFLFLICLIGFIINLAILIQSGGIEKLRTLSKTIFWIFPTLGILEILAVTAFYAAVNAITEPAVNGFLGNLFPLFTTILGIFFLKERFSKIETLGIVIVFCGALLTSYSGNISYAEFFIPGAGFVALNCLAAAIATVIVRAKVNNLTPEILSFNRIFWLLLFFSGWILFAHTPFVVTSNGFWNTVVAAILDPVLAILLVYKAYRFIEASRGTIIQSSKGILIIPIAFLFFGTLPLIHQLLGGILSMIGVVIIAIGQSVINARKGSIPNSNLTSNKADECGEVI